MRLSEFIFTNLEEILSEWEAFAITIPVTSGMDVAALRDDASSILTVIAHDMVTNQTADEQKKKSRGKGPRVGSFGTRSSELHSVARFESGFNLTEMVSEYRALRATVIRLWLPTLSQFGADGLLELTRFNEGIDQALAESVTYYSELRDRARDLVTTHQNEFLATLAHELRNPLAPLRNAVYWLRSNVNTAGDETIIPGKTLEMMERQIGQLARLIDDLLDVARINSGKIDLRRQATNIGTIVNDALEASVMQPDAHRVRVALPNRPLYIEADAARLTQVVSNLLNNAVKFSSESSPIEVKLERTDNDIELTVKDSGIGIQADKLEEIFGMFTQVNRSLERSKSGLGIGLTLARQIVEMHGGTIHAVSEGIARGSMFVVRLPWSSQTSAVEHPQPRTDAVSSKRVLIADDNRDGVDSMGLLLGMAGHDVHVAYGGLEALEAAVELHPDIIMLDLGMPEMNGLEVAKKIRQQNWSNHVTLIAVTGWGQNEDHQRSMDAGFDFHLVKPVELSTLMQLFRDIECPDRLP